MPTFYVLDDVQELSAIISGTVSDAIERDLAELTKRPLILRTDGTNIPVLRKKSVRGYSSREILLMSKGLPFLVRLWHPAALCESFLPYCP